MVSTSVKRGAHRHSPAWHQQRSEKSNHTQQARHLLHHRLLGIHVAVVLAQDLQVGVVDATITVEVCHVVIPSVPGCRAIRPGESDHVTEVHTLVAVDIPDVASRPQRDCQRPSNGLRHRPLPFVARGFRIHSSVEPLCKTVNVTVHTLPRPWTWPALVPPSTRTLPADASTAETKLDGTLPPWFRKSPSCTDFTEKY